MFYQPIHSIVNKIVQSPHLENSNPDWIQLAYPSVFSFIVISLHVANERENYIEGGRDKEEQGNEEHREIDIAETFPFPGILIPQKSLKTGDAGNQIHAIEN
jgi:hypothetical protein